MGGGAAGRRKVRRARLTRLEPERVHELLELLLADRAALVEVHEVEDLTKPEIGARRAG